LAFATWAGTAFEKSLAINLAIDIMLAQFEDRSPAKELSAPEIPRFRSSSPVVRMQLNFRRFLAQYLETIVFQSVSLLCAKSRRFDHFGRSLDSST
jgi:hypothetical protein